jgi:predicted TIM-barrel fold metal-dependent hydrolase
LSKAEVTDQRGSGAPPEEPLIDVHAHFLHDRSGRADWSVINGSRLAAGDRIGITCHVASILGSWGATSPTYMPSPDDVSYGNRAMLDLQTAESHRVRSYVMVNPNDRTHALAEIEAAAARGAVGLKLAASRRANDPLLNEIIHAAQAHSFPVLHHVWQHRRRDWPSQEVSDATELLELAARHAGVPFILAHIGGGGDYEHTFSVVRDAANVFLDISGSGVDRGMLDGAVAAVGAGRLLWGSDLTMETGLAKLRALAYAGLTQPDIAAVRWRNAARIFPPGSFSMLGLSGTSA